MVSMTKQESTIIETPTVKQIRIAFEQTPNKLRLAEQGWRERRKQVIARSPPIRREYRPEDGTAKIQTRHEAKYPTIPPATPKAVKSAKPMTRPLTPPPTPLIVPTISHFANNVNVDKVETPGLILAYPLAASEGIPLGRDGFLSIPHPPSRLRECVLQIGTQRISVARGGTSIEVENGGKSRSIHLNDHRSWSRKEWRQWNMVLDLVEQVKRKTPRIRIYHPSALITITSSSIPDIIIACTMPIDRLNLGQAGDIKPVMTVKLVYSSSRNRIIIDTDAKHGVESESTYRTRRRIPLPPSHMSMLVTRRRTSSTAAALGLVIGQDWLAAEVEAVQRFWALREEWLRYLIS